MFAETNDAQSSKLAAMRDERNAATRLETGLAKALVEIRVKFLIINIHEERFAGAECYPGKASFKRYQMAFFNKRLIINEVVHVCAQLIDLWIVNRQAYKVVP